MRLRRNQKPAVATTPARKTPNAFLRMPGGTKKMTPIAIAAAAPEIVSLLPSAIPIASPARSKGPNGAAAGGASGGDLSPITGEAVRRSARGSVGVPPAAPPTSAPGGRDLPAAQALTRIATAARSSATGAVSVAAL